MTVPVETMRALSLAREFLLDLLDRSKTRGVPKGIRERAYRVLKHYPGDFTLEQLQKKCPEILGEKNE